MKIHKITRWSVEAVLASAFRAGRVFLAGGRGAPPPAHRRAGTDQRDPRRAEPVLETRAGPGRPRVTGAAGHLPSRAPSGRSAQRAAVAGNAAGHFEIAAALGLSHQNAPGRTWRSCAGCGPARTGDAGYRSGVLRAMRAQSMEFSELNVEYGYRYQSAAVVPDGSAAPMPADEIRVYQPFTRPETPCRTSGSRTRMATAARSRTSSRRGGSCRSPGRTARPGARRPGNSPRKPTSRSTRCGSATSTATTTTRAADGSATGRSPATAPSWCARTGSSPGGTRPAAANCGPSWLPRSARSSPGQSARWPLRPPEACLRPASSRRVPGALITDDARRRPPPGPALIWTMPIHPNGQWCMP